QDSCFALICDSNGGQVLRADATVPERLPDYALRAIPDFVDIVFDPAGLRIELLVFFLRGSDHVPFRITDGETGAGRALIDCSDVVGHGRYSKASRGSLVGARCPPSRRGHCYAADESEDAEKEGSDRYHGPAATGSRKVLSRYLWFLSAVGPP